MQNALIRVAPVAALFAAIGCGGSSTKEQSRTPVEAASPALRTALPVPKPIPGGDPLSLVPPFNPQFHQFLPGKTFDGEWVEPNGITDFLGTVAQVYMGGKATDAVTGTVFDVEVDTRVYQGAFVDVDGKPAYGTFCEI